MTAAGSADRHRLVAFYLPQFHPIPENDRWWRPGFTEWTNVTAARPQLRGHRQPRVPGALGYYDLLDPDVRAAQAELAAAHRIDAFCYYHYWFEGRRLLERPLQEVLDSGEPDFPFMVCWANESWSRRWDGGDHDVLQQQRYSAEDDVQHIRALLPVLADPRYVQVDGRPILLVYRTDELPDPRATAERWRSVADRAGVSLYLCLVQSSRALHLDPAAVGFDAAVQFLPQRAFLGNRVGWESASRRLVRRTLGRRSAEMRHMVFEYETLVRAALAEPLPPYKRYPCVVPDWDNSPRNPSRGARILLGSTPDRYHEWLLATLRRFHPYSPEENLVFVNAWNEWAESAYLEPDEHWGLDYLVATRKAVERANGDAAADDVDPPGGDGAVRRPRP